MSNYYTHTNGLPANQTRGIASQIRNELDGIADSFALLPTAEELVTGQGNFLVDTGTVNAYTATASTEITAYTDGQTFKVKAINGNTASTTIDINGLGAVPITRPGGLPINAYDIVSGQVFEITYLVDSNSFQLSLNGLSGTDVTAVAMADATHFASAETTPADTDEIGILNSGLSFVLNKLTWANLKTSLGFSANVLAVGSGGTGAATLADGGLMIGNAAGAVEVVPAGATTEILVGGGALTKPVFTTATGSGAPVRATSPTLVTPILGTPTSGNISNCTGGPTLTSATLVTSAIGTPSSGILTNCTGLPPAGVTGTAAVLGANTFTGAQTLPAAGAILTGTISGTTTLVAGAAASGTAVLPATGGQLTVMADTNPLAKANGYYSTAAAAAGISVADDDDLDNPYNNITLHFEGSLPNWTTPSETTFLCSKAYDASNRLQLTLNTDGKIQLFWRTTATATIVNVTTTNANTFSAGSSHKVTCVFTRGATADASTVGIFFDGVLFETLVPGSGTPTADGSNAGAFQVLGYLNTRQTGTANTVILYSRALTATEVASLCTNGISASDMWGSQTSLNTDAIVNTTSGYNYSTFSGASATGFTAASSGPDSVATTTDSINFVAGKRYRVSFTASGTLGSTNSITALVTSVTAIALVTGTTAHAMTLGINTVEYIPTQTITGCVSWETVGTASYTISNFSIVEIGATLALLPENVQAYPGNWIDATGNTAGGVIPATGVTPLHYAPIIFGRPGGQTITGGTAATDVLSLVGTSGTGTATSPAVQIKVGTNGGTTAITTLNNGNVGIGAASPVAKLQIEAGSLFANASYSDAVGAFNPSSEAIYNMYGSGAYWGIRTASTSKSFNIDTYNTGSPKNVFTILQAGNVGIGTAGPGYKLEISTDSAGKPGVGGLWTVVSDERTKDIIAPADLDRCVEIIEQTPLYYAKYKDGFYKDGTINDKHFLTPIAQDVQKVFPSAVQPHRVEFAADIIDGEEEYQEQDFTVETVTESVTSIEVIDGVPTQITKQVEKENKIMLFDDVPMVDQDGNQVMEEYEVSPATPYIPATFGPQEDIPADRVAINENGNAIIGQVQLTEAVEATLAIMGTRQLTHKMPRMITKTRPKITHETIEDCLDLNAGQLNMALYGAVQSLIARVKELEAKLS